jgi:predicted DsbA family dithiol-disulfide isomerase
MRIDIFADPVCPWCYVGKRRLERALAMRPEIPVVTVWRPFQLNPDMPKEGVDADTFFAAKFGGAAQIKERRAVVAEIGASVGIEFDFERITREPNTLDAHRLLRFAQMQGDAAQLAEGLFRAHFSEGRDIGDHATLIEIGVATGLDRREVTDFLAGGGAGDIVLAEEQEARRIGVNAVPCYIFERQYAVSGAQEPEFFLPVFDLVLNGKPAQV